LKKVLSGLSLPRLALVAVLPIVAASAVSFGQVTPTAQSSTLFSHLAFEGGIGVMGINMQAATDLNPHLNLRATGNFFTYSINNVKVSGSGGSNGVNVNGNLNFATMGLSVDYYPWARHGFRLSPGVMLLNRNAISATGIASVGTSLTIGSQKYYSEAANPINLSAQLGLNTHPQTFTMTTGWGNMISRKGGHWAVPFEVGAAFTGVPTLGLNLTGYGCTTQSDAPINGESCVNMATNTTAKNNLASQIATYQKDLNPLQVYPILSIGLSYNFRIR
jgi:hypothetical protein